MKKYKILIAVSAIMTAVTAVKAEEMLDFDGAASKVVSIGSSGAAGSLSAFARLAAVERGLPPAPEAGIPTRVFTAPEHAIDLAIANTNVSLSPEFQIDNLAVTNSAVPPLPKEAMDISNTKELLPTDIKVITGSAEGEWILTDANSAQWVITGWQMRIQNIGTTPIAHLKFRLNIWKAENNVMMYSQIHTIDINLNPQDILTSKTFPLNEKFWYAEKDIFLENKFGWSPEILQAW